MKTLQVEIPEELLKLFKKSRLGSRPVEEQVRWALAVLLLQEGVISTGRAAALAGEPRASFELLLGEMSVPVVTYTLEDYLKDAETLERLFPKRV